MSINIPSHFNIQYATDVQLLLQQQGSLLRSRVSTGEHTGKQASPVDQMGATEAQTPAGRFAPLGNINFTVDRRWVFPTDVDHPQRLDKNDMLRLFNSQKYLAKMQQNAANAMGRKIDDIIIAAALASAVTGETGSGSEAFDTTNHVVANSFGASGAVGLTVAKLIEMRRIWETANVNLGQEDITMVIGPKQHANLLQQQELISRDYGPPRLENGMVKEAMGISFVVSNRLTTSGSDRYCLGFLRSGLYLGVWNDVETRVTERDDLSSIPWQVYTFGTFGATRLEAGKVIRVSATE